MEKGQLVQTWQKQKRNPTFLVNFPIVFLHEICKELLNFTKVQKKSWKELPMTMILIQIAASTYWSYAIIQGFHRVFSASFLVTM